MIEQGDVYVRLYQTGTGKNDHIVHQEIRPVRQPGKKTKWIIRVVVNGRSDFGCYTMNDKRFAEEVLSAKGHFAWHKRKAHTVAQAQQYYNAYDLPPKEVWAQAPPADRLAWLQAMGAKGNRLTMAHQTLAELPLAVSDAYFAFYLDEGTSEIRSRKAELVAMA